MSVLHPADEQIDIRLKLGERHTPAIRLWHWLTFITLSCSIITVILASTLFTMKANVPMIQQQLQEKGLRATPDQARAVAHEYSDILWHTHKYLGYGLAFLLLCRILIEFAQPSGETIKRKISRVMKFQFTNPGQKKNRIHYLWVQSGYLFFYFCILVMAVTGLGMAYEDVPFLKNINESLSTIHKVFQFCIYGYIFFHILGVILAEKRFPGLVSRMIHGRSNVS